MSRCERCGCVGREQRGNGELSLAQQTLVTLLGLDPMLVQAAAEGSRPLETHGQEREQELKAWVEELASDERDALLWRCLHGDLLGVQVDAQRGLEARRARGAHGTPAAVRGEETRSALSLLKRADKLRAQEKARLKAERKAAEAAAKEEERVRLEAKHRTKKALIKKLREAKF